MKKLIFSGIVVTMLASGALYASKSFKAIDLTNIQLANIEALAEVEEDDCHYTNGYKAFTGKKGGGYDCCLIWRELKPEEEQVCTK